MSTPWSVPRMWEGQTCVILGGGESLTPEVIEAVRPTPYRVIAINEAYKLAPWADLLYAADKDWWHVNKGAPNFLGMKVTCEVNAYEDVLQLKVGNMVGFDPDPSVICTGGNSGYQAICIAAHAGCARVLLCGYDMKGKHWHDEHKPPLRETRPEQYPVWVERFKTLVKPLKELGVSVINCTPGSALDAFPRSSIAAESARDRWAA